MLTVISLVILGFLAWRREVGLRRKIAELEADLLFGNATITSFEKDGYGFLLKLRTEHNGMRSLFLPPNHEFRHQVGTCVSVRIRPSGKEKARLSLEPADKLKITNLDAVTEQPDD